MMHWYPWSWSWSWQSAIGMGVMWLLWAVVIGVLVWALLGLAERPRRAVAAHQPKAILDLRLARGLVSVAEYRQALQALDGRAPTAPTAS